MFGEQTQEEIQAHLDGPVAPAWRWLQAVLRDGDYQQAWNLSDRQWRLMRAQAWVLRMETGLDLDALDRVADELADQGPLHPLWTDFVEDELDLCQERLAAWDLTDMGVGSKPRPLDLDYEIVLFTKGRDWRIYDDDSLVRVLPFVMHFVDGEWLVAAAGSDKLPIPRQRGPRD